MQEQIGTRFGQEAHPHTCTEPCIVDAHTLLSQWCSRRADYEKFLDLETGSLWCRREKSCCLSSQRIRLKELCSFSLDVIEQAHKTEIHM